MVTRRTVAITGVPGELFDKLAGGEVGDTDERARSLGTRIFELMLGGSDARSEITLEAVHGLTARVTDETEPLQFDGKASRELEPHEVELLRENLSHVLAWKKIIDASEVIDPEAEIDWADMMLGFFLRRGLPSTVAGPLNHLVAYVLQDMV